MPMVNGEMMKTKYLGDNLKIAQINRDGRVFKDGKFTGWTDLDQSILVRQLDLGQGRFGLTVENYQGKVLATLDDDEVDYRRNALRIGKDYIPLIYIVHKIAGKEDLEIKVYFGYKGKLHLITDRVGPAVVKREDRRPFKWMTRVDELGVEIDREVIAKIIDEEDETIGTIERLRHQGFVLEHYGHMIKWLDWHNHNG